MRTNWLFLALSSLLVSACSLTVPNTRVCAVAGVMSAGADCGYTLSDQTEEMSLQEFIEFLEPQPERADPKDAAKRLPARGPALCQSTEDYAKLKIALEQACKKLGTKCAKEVKEGIRAVSTRIDALQVRVASKVVHPIFPTKKEKR